ncbi:MAG: hypothetical protein KF782_08885 [Labilithrix sp.]|nr:hypothetical protein [Labilithrix sp.]
MSARGRCAAACALLFVAGGAHAAETPRAAVDDAAETRRAPAETRGAGAPKPPGRFEIGVLAGANVGTFVGVPVTRAGAALVVSPRGKLVGGSLSFEGGRSENGLGAHRAEIAFDLRTPAYFVGVRGGLHVAYAMLVRTTGTDRFFRALGGDIASFALGAHAAIEARLPLRAGLTLTAAGRLTFDVYDGGAGYSLGPQVGLVL